MPLKRLLALLLSAALLLPALYACSEQTEESGDVSRSAGTDADALAQVQHYLDYYKEHPFTSYREVAAVYALGVSFDGYDLSALEPDEKAGTGEKAGAAIAGALLEKAGGRGVGLGGMDGGMFQAKRLTDRTGTDYGYVGDIVEVNPAPVIDMLEKGYIPVVSTVAQGIDDETNYNINADTAACKLAVALGAKKLILLTDVRGLMLDPEDESTLLRFLKVSEVPKLMRDGVIKGGMIPKVDCCVEAVRKGVEAANIQDGRVKHSILIELLSKVGVGTMFQ